MPSGASIIPRADVRENCAPAARGQDREAAKRSPGSSADPASNDRTTQVAGRRAIRQRCGWILLAAVLLFAALATPHFRGMIYAADDLWAFHLPVRAFYADCLERGLPFDWMPQLYSGFYLTGEGQGGVYHPLHWLLYSTLPLRTAFNLEVLLPYPLLFAGAFFWLQRRIHRADAAMFGALCLTFGSFSLLHFVHPNATAIIAHIPWCLWCVDLAITSRSGRARALAAGGLALLTTSQILLGYPQYVWFSLLATACYGLWLARYAYRKWPWQKLFASAGFLLLGAVAGGVQLLPTFDALAHSTRRAVDAEFANSGALHPANLAQVVAPYALQTRVFGNNTHELGCYLGAIPLLLLVWLALNFKQLPARYRRLALAFCAFAGISLLLCLGKTGGLYWLQMQLPVVGSFRMPARYLVLTNFAVSGLVAVAFAAITRGRDASANRTQHALAISHNYLGIVLASLVVSLAIYIIWNADRAASLPLVLVGPAMIAAGAFLVSRFEQGKRLAVPLLVLFTAVDLGVYGLSYAVWPGAASVEQVQASLATAIPRDPHGRIVVDEHGAGEAQLRAGNQAVLGGGMLADGYAGLEPATALPLSDANALRLAGVSLVANRGANATLAGIESTENAPWQAVDDPFPRARLVSRSIAAAEPDFAELLTQHDPAEVALVDQPLQLGGGEPGGGEPGIVTRATDTPGRILLEVDAPDAQLLIVNERFHPGWRVFVDGKPAQVVRTYGQYLGCVVDRESHAVEFEFAPESLRYGKWVTLLGLALILGITGVRVARASTTSDSN